jgi:RHS repeat-associated protein
LTCNRLYVAGTGSRTISRNRAGPDLCASNLTQTTLPSANGHVETRVYDRAGRPTEVKAEKAGVTLARFVSDLDPVGNPLSVVRTGALPETQTYTYDVNDRLKTVCFQAGTCPGASDPFVRWTYDRVGNRLTAERPGQTLTYTHNALDQLTAVGSTSFTYDQNGNQLTRATRVYTYDQANRMQSAAVSGTTTMYSYDGDGVRLQASTGPSASEKTNVLWDVNQALPQLALERDGAGGLLRRYSYGLQRLTMVSGSTTSYYHHDGLGSVSAITGGAGNTRWTYAYEPFGIIRTEQQGSGTQPANFLKFTGEYLDPTGLYHLRARQYDPTWSRFLSPNPLDPGVGSLGESAYSYAGNRPTVMVDPSGETYQPSSDGQLAAFEASSRASLDLVDVAYPPPGERRTADSTHGFVDLPQIDARTGRRVGSSKIYIDAGISLNGRQARVRFLTRSSETNFVSYDWDCLPECGGGGALHSESPVRFNAYLPRNGVFQIVLKARYRRHDSARSGAVTVRFDRIRCASRARDPKCWFIDD